MLPSPAATVYMGIQPLQDWLFCIPSSLLPNFPIVFRTSGPPVFRPSRPPPLCILPQKRIHQKTTDMRKRQNPLSLLAMLALLISSPAISQTPVLKVDHKEDPSVFLKGVDIDVKVVGNVAITTLKMVFFNSTSRILEGELTIPLPDGVWVSRYAIDINGALREAVPVDKAKGTQVFEAIERRGVDPGLLEKVDGNNFRTRIYPIPANGQRTVLIGYEQELGMDRKKGLKYHLPLDYKKAVPSFNLAISIQQSAQAPILEESPDDISLEKWQYDYTASLHKSNFLPKHSLTFYLPKGEDIAETALQPAEEGFYFMVNQYFQGESRNREMPSSLTIIWDVSLSGLARDHKKELDFIGALIKRKKNIHLSLNALNNQYHRIGDFNITNGDWSALKKTIEGFTYDGGSNFNVLPSAINEETLFFTDGLSPFFNFKLPTTTDLIHTICASPKADFSGLKYLSQQTGGQFINLNELNTEEAVGLITQRALLFLGIKANAAIQEVYPSLPTPVISQCTIAGHATELPATLTLLFGYGKQVVKEKKIVLTASSLSSSKTIIEKLWAQKKIADLDIRYEENKAAIEQTGKKYGIVTRNTSLIVLETVEDYLQYEIEPPAELEAEYRRRLKERNQFTNNQHKAVENNAAYYFRQLKIWYGLPIDEEEPVEKKEVRPINGNVGAGNNVQDRDTFLADSTRAYSAPPAASQFSNQASLNEVVVTALGVQRNRKALGYSTATVRSSAFSSSSNLGQALQGKASGLAISQSPGIFPSTTQIHLRGVSNNQTNNTQVIIDGQESTLEDLARLNPHDVESVVIQKSGAYIPGPSQTVNYYFNRKDPSAPKIKWKKLRYITDSSRALFDAKDFSIKTPYIIELMKVAEEKRYQKYLELRNKHLNSPSFYFNTALWFIENDDYETGMMLLSNLPELNLQDHEVYKMAGYKLKELGDYQGALAIFKKILEWRPMEPQSFRDYGLALADAGCYQEALDTLYLGLTQNYAGEVRGLYPGIEETMVTDINNLIARHPNGLNISKIPKSLIQAMPVDIRVVLNWNMNDTDMDLWVTDPNGEKCYYSHKTTQIGGHISNDFTRGYGPEQFLLKKAITGTYKVQLDFYGERQVKLAGATTVQAEIFIHYGTPQEQRQLVTLQMNKEKRGAVLVAEFEFKK